MQQFQVLQGTYYCKILHAAGQQDYDCAQYWIEKLSVDILVFTSLKNALHWT